MTLLEKIEFVENALKDPSYELENSTRNELTNLLEQITMCLDKGSLLNKGKISEENVLSKETLESYKDTLRKYYQVCNDVLPPQTVFYFTDFIKTLELRLDRMVPFEFAQLIKNRRIELGIRLEAFAEAINVSVGYINRLENGIQSTPNVKIIFSIANYLMLSPLDVLKTLDIPFNFYQEIEMEDFLNYVEAIKYKNKSLTKKQISTLKKRTETYVSQCIDKNESNEK